MTSIQEALVMLINAAAPGLIGGLALLDRSERYRHLARTLTGLPLLWGLLLAKALLVGVDLRVSSHYALAAMSAPIAMYLAIGNLAARRYGVLRVMSAGMLAYVASAYVLVRLAPHLPPLYWAAFCVLAQWICRTRLEDIERWTINHTTVAGSQSVKILLLSRMALALIVVSSISRMKSLGDSAALLLCVFPSASTVGVIFNLTEFGARETCRYLAHALKLAPSLVATVLVLCYLPSCWESWAAATGLGLIVGLLLMRSQTMPKKQ